MRVGHKCYIARKGVGVVGDEINKYKEFLSSKSSVWLTKKTHDWLKMIVVGFVPQPTLHLLFCYFSNLIKREW